MNFSIEPQSKITSNAAVSIYYDNNNSGLSSDCVQDAIDELYKLIKTLQIQVVIPPQDGDGLQDIIDLPQ